METVRSGRRHRLVRRRVGAARGMGGRVTDGADGTPVTIRSGGVSKSATKAPRAGIGREEKRGISTILCARSGSIRAFVADLDIPCRRGPPEGAPRAGRRPRRAPRRANRAHRPRRRPPRMPPDAETCTSHSKVQLQPSFSRAKCTSRRGRGQPQPSRTTATTPRSTTTPASRPPLLVRKAHPAIPRARETGVSRSAPPRVLPHHCADPGQP